MALLSLTILNWLLPHIPAGTIQELSDPSEAEGSAGGEDPIARFLQAARIRQAQMKAFAIRPFDMSPLSGAIPPYSTITVTVRFKPTRKEVTKGFASNIIPAEQHFSYLGQFHFDGCAIS